MDNVATLLNGKMVGLLPSSVVLKRCVLEKIKFSDGVHVGEDTFFSNVKYHCKRASISTILVEMLRHLVCLLENYQHIIETGVHGVEGLFSILSSSYEITKLKNHLLVKDI